MKNSEFIVNVNRRKAPLDRSTRPDEANHRKSILLAGLLGAALVIALAGSAFAAEAPAAPAALVSAPELEAGFTSSMT